MSRIQSFITNSKGRFMTVKLSKTKYCPAENLSARVVKETPCYVTFATNHSNSGARILKVSKKTIAQIKVAGKVASRL